MAKAQPNLLPDEPTLAREVARYDEAPRAEAVAALKELRRRVLAAIAKSQLDNLNEITGLDVVTWIARLADVLVTALTRRAFARAGAPADWTDRAGVIALGGYGRGELNPHSDLDLLVVALPQLGGLPAWLTAANAELQALLWDVQYTLGASLHGLPELERIVDEDFITATALIEQRPLLAGEPVAQALREAFVRFRRKRGTAFLKYKVEELAKRRAQAGASPFRMEPDLKANPGCLRDVQLLRNVAGIVFGSRDLFALADLEAITRQDLTEVLVANDHLLTLRTLQHFHHGRKQDVFQLTDQVRVARQLGYTDVSRLRAVEHFMRRHYALVRHVHQMVDVTVSRLRATGHLGRAIRLVKTRQVIDPDFTAVAGQVYLSHQDFWRLDDAGARLLRLCRLAQRLNLRLSFELQRAIRAHREVVTDEVRGDGALGRVFLELLGDLGRTRPILEDMHDAGLLGAYLPEFGNLTCLMQFDSYHQYTADQHSLLAMGHLDAVARGEVAGLPGLRLVFPGIGRKDLLALGLLLHDMGKYMGRGHVARGAIMVEEVAQRLGLAEDEEELVRFLVEHHVELSDASRMRDFREPAFLRELAERIGNQAQLDLLYCLTYADTRAVGEGVLTGWQETLLGELYRALSEQLRQTSRHTRASPHERLRAALAAAGATADQAEAFLGGLPASYVHQVTPAETVRHWRVLGAARESGIGLDHEFAEAAVSLAAAIPDRHALFADVTATLSGHGFDIIDARTWITAPPRREPAPASPGPPTAGVVIYSFRLAPIFPARAREPQTWTRLHHDLLAVSRGELSAESLLAKRRRSLATPRPADSGFDEAAIKVEQRTSEHHTIVDIHTRDEVGLLSRLCRGISSYGCEISYAGINTMGDVAVDVFYVNRAGAKLADDDAEGLRRHLISTLHLDESAPTSESRGPQPKNG